MSGAKGSTIGGADGDNAQLQGKEPPTSEEAERSVLGATKGKRHRRVRTAAVPGSDPAPQPEPPRLDPDENDDRLKADRPPHWHRGV